MTVTVSATQTVFHADCRSDGVSTYSRNCRSPTKAPLRSSTALTRIVNNGASRKTTRTAQTPNSKICARRSCQWACGFTRARFMRDLGCARVALTTALPCSAEQAHALGWQPDVERRSRPQRHAVDAVARDVDEHRLFLGATEGDGDHAEGAEELDLHHRPRGKVLVTFERTVD